MIDFDGIEKLMEDEMRRCLTTAYDAPIDSDVHKSAIESAIELYKATEKKLDNDEKRAGEQLKTETSGQQEENKLKFEKKKHADFVRNERDRIKNERDKNIIDSCIFRLQCGQRIQNHQQNSRTDTRKDNWLNLTRGS